MSHAVRPAVLLLVSCLWLGGCATKADNTGQAATASNANGSATQAATGDPQAAEATAADPSAVAETNGSKASPADPSAPQPVEQAKVRPSLLIELMVRPLSGTLQNGMDSMMESAGNAISRPEEKSSKPDQSHTPESDAAESSE